MRTYPELAALDLQHLIHPLHQRTEQAASTIWVRGTGAVIEDITGRKYIDALAGLWNVNVGHGREELAEAAAVQMKALAYSSCYVGSANVPAIELAHRITELAGGRMQAVFFTSGGAEANETALKTARFFWKACDRPEKVKIIARQHGYHGLSLQAMSATAVGAAYWKMFEPRVPGFVHVQTCHPYRHETRVAGETPGQSAARELEEAILREGPETVAAFIAEPIPGVGGVLYPTDDYWPRVRDVCSRYNVLLIADEIITGFGRTGRWFALAHWNVQPDIISFAKGVTSGYLPLGGIAVSGRIKDAIDGAGPDKRWMHAFTNSGHPACCAVGLKNIEIIERERLLERSEKMGARLHNGLTAALSDHPHVGDIRGGLGLMAAVEIVRDRATKENFPPEVNIAARIYDAMMQRGVVARTRPSTGCHPSPGDIVVFAPPLVITESEIDELVGVTHDSVNVAVGAADIVSA